MTPEAWAAIGSVAVATVTAASTVIVAIVGVRQREDLRRGREAAEKAADQTVNISNGFAEKTTSTLADVAEQTRANSHTLSWVVHALTDHLELHAKATERARREAEREGGDDDSPLPR